MSSSFLHESENNVHLRVTEVESPSSGVSGLLIDYHFDYLSASSRVSFASLITE